MRLNEDIDFRGQYLSLNQRYTEEILHTEEILYFFEIPNFQITIQNNNYGQEKLGITNSSPDTVVNNSYEK